MAFQVSSHFHIPIIFIILSVFMLSYEVVVGQNEVNMKINNTLGENIPLHLHCKSKNDDIGYHHLGYGESLSWWFFPNFFFHNTLFWCNMQWKSAQGWVRGSFEVYNEEHDLDRCNTQCLWSINANGAYVFDQTKNQFVRMHSWW